jgi:hypothetical protein
MPLLAHLCRDFRTNYPEPPPKPALNCMVPQAGTLFPRIRANYRISRTMRPGHVCKCHVGKCHVGKDGHVI